MSRDRSSVDPIDQEDRPAARTTPGGPRRVVASPAQRVQRLSESGAITSSSSGPGVPIGKAMPPAVRGDLADHGERSQIELLPG